MGVVNAMSGREYSADCVFAHDLRADPAALHRSLRAHRRDRWELVGMFRAGSELILMLFKRRRRASAGGHITSRAA